MLDLETLGVSPNSVILTLGAVKFDPYNDIDPDDALYCRLDVDQQTAMGREIDPNTVEWWGKQSEEAIEEALGEENRVSLEVATKELNKFVVGAKEIWAQGIVFDIGMLENLYQQIQQPAPWRFYQIRDSRTLLGLANYNVRNMIGQKGLHKSLDDAFYQAKAVQKVFKDLGIKK